MALPLRPFLPVPPPLIPVSSGSRDARTLDAGPFRVTTATFPASGAIPPHTHDRPVVGFMQGGSFELTFPGLRTCDCVPGSVFIEPAGETHCNCMGTAGARVLVVEPAPHDDTLPRAAADALLRPVHFRHPGMSGLARRMAAELARPDELSLLSLEGLALELVVHLARERRDTTGSWPAWLDRVEDLLRARFREPLSIATLAREARVHPSHLARTFRRRYRTSVAGYIRALRLDYAGQRLAQSGDPIAAIAADAGFADQSHFTRRFREHTGATPMTWRRAHRR